ncbi:EVE domain-containing protein [Rhizobium sp.]
MTAWIAIASADHVAHGRACGFMQVCHGKTGPLMRIRPGDDVIYYSPSTEMGGGKKVQSFTAAGRVADGEAYRFDMGNGFVPTRRDVEWLETQPVPIQPLLDELEFTRGKSSWGYVFRFGVVKISDADRDVILRAMLEQAKAPPVTATRR